MCLLSGSGEVGFLPEFAFPFVKLFGPKAESAFEAVSTLLLNWCKGWFELFPNPPLPLLRRFLVGGWLLAGMKHASLLRFLQTAFWSHMDINGTVQGRHMGPVAATYLSSCACLPNLVALQLMLSQHDLQLGGHLQQLGVPLLERVWHIMSGGMSELLPAADDWLVLWDHCLAAASGPAFYYSVLAAYLITQRTHLLGVTNQQELDRVFAARPAVDVRKVGRSSTAAMRCAPAPLTRRCLCNTCWLPCLCCPTVPMQWSAHVVLC
jgi:hypothetical protein